MYTSINLVYPRVYENTPYSCMHSKVQNVVARVHVARAMAIMLVHAVHTTPHWSILWPIM